MVVGTRTLTSFDGCVQTSGEAVSYYLLAVRERQESSKKSYGVCFVDTCVGTFHVRSYSNTCARTLSRDKVTRYVHMHVHVICMHAMLPVTCYEQSICKR